MQLNSAWQRAGGSTWNSIEFVTLARHLLLKSNKTILLLERRADVPSPHQKVGESTVQLGAAAIPLVASETATETSTGAVLFQPLSPSAVSAVRRRKRPCRGNL